MSHPEIRLKYVATLNNEALGEDTDPDYELQYIDIGNVDSSGQVHEVASYRFADAPSRARRRVRHGDVIVSCVRTYLQAIAPIESPPDNLIVSTGFAVVRPIEGRLRAGFCKYALREPRFLAEVERRSVGVSYPAINSSDLAAIPIPAPPDDLQLRIEKFLDRETARLDALVAAKQRVLDLLAEKRKAIIATAVTRGLDPKVKLRDSGVPWLGEIPAHWEVVPFRWYFRIGSGDFIATDEVASEPDAARATPVIGGNGVAGYAAAANTSDTASIVVGRVGAQCGNVHVVTGPAWVTDNALLLRDIREYEVEYLAHVLRHRDMNSIANKTAQPLITGSMVTELRGPLPVLDEQRAIVAHIARETAKLDAVRAATERTIALLKERRSALIAAAVTGQLDVRAAT